MQLAPYVSQTIWGGRRLIDEYHIPCPPDAANCAEAWMLSAHPRGSSVILNGSYTGLPLARVYPDLPVLVKFIDAQDDLSVQVHPPDGASVLRPGEAGKTECWRILDASPGAKLYLGFRESISRETFCAAIADGTLMDHIQPYEVQPGEFYMIPAGTLHAIGKGILLAEVQQNSDTTYRVYDHGRGRFLQVEQALTVTKLEPYQNSGSGCCDYFSIAVCNAPFTGVADDGFVSLVVLEGAGALHWAGETLPLAKGESVFLPSGVGEYACAGAMQILRTRV